MFNKKLFVILVFLLFVLQISFVSAQSDNQTDLINKSDEIDYSLNNCSFHKFENKIESNNFTDKFEFYQGVIPIKIDSPADGELKVLVDDCVYRVWDFSKNEIIYLNTYNSESFYNDSELNIDVGLHDISFIFNFKNYKYNDVNIFIDENSTLNFNFHGYYSPALTGNAYIYNSTFNILKKDKKTIHILNFTYYNLCECGEYIINIDNLKYHEYIGGYLYGVIVINENNEIICKERDLWVDGFVAWGISHLNEVGVYNLTVINFIDGTMDSVLFKAIKYRPKLNISYIVNGTSIYINITKQSEYCNDWIYINVDNITHELPMYLYEDNIWQVCFENLSSGVHMLNIDYIGDHLSEDVFYSMSFEIEDVLDNENNNAFNQSNIDQNSSDDKNLSFIIGNTTSGNTSNIGGSVKNHIGTINSYSKKDNLNFKENIINSFVGEDKLTHSTLNSDDKKSYEIIKKSAFKSVSGITQLQLIVIVIILLLIGYFNFSAKNKKGD